MLVLYAPPLFEQDHAIPACESDVGLDGRIYAACWDGGRVGQGCRIKLIDLKPKTGGSTDDPGVHCLGACAGGCTGAQANLGRTAPAPNQGEVVCIAVVPAGTAEGDCVAVVITGEARGQIAIAVLGSASGRAATAVVGNADGEVAVVVYGCSGHTHGSYAVVRSCGS